MVRWFPDPYPDELLYSVLARFHQWSGNEAPKRTMEQLFGKPTVIAVADLPSHLTHLAQAIGSGEHPYSAQTLLERHTLWTYYRPFLQAFQAAAVRNAMLADRGDAIHLQIGVIAGSTPNEWTRHRNARIVNPFHGNG